MADFSSRKKSKISDDFNSHGSVMNNSTGNDTLNHTNYTHSKTSQGDAGNDKSSVVPGLNGNQSNTNTQIPSKVKVQFSSLLNESDQAKDVDPLDYVKASSGSADFKSFFIPLKSSIKDLNLILNTTNNHSRDKRDRKDRRDEDEEDMSNVEYNFYVNDKLIAKSLEEIMNDPQVAIGASENTILIQYIPKAIFKVRSVNRCSSTMTGHSQPVLTALYSPNGRMLASGSGDCNVRIWDLNTETPQHCLTGHTGWVQHVAWSPNCKVLASAGMDGTIRLWDPIKGTSLGIIKAHSQPITALAFEPMHLNMDCNRLVSTSKDGTAKVWDITRRVILATLSGHTAPVMCVKWSGEGKIFTGGRDKMIKMWDGKELRLLGNLIGHGHWVNSLAMMSDFICRSGPFDHTDPKFTTSESAYAAALKRYTKFIETLPNKKDLLASCSDDFTIMLWSPSSSTKPLNRMTGHQQAVNHLCFSPNGHVLASASFDKSIKLWNALSPTPGVFLTTLRGHVGAVYQICFSSDSRKCISASRDSTCKVWDIEATLSTKTHKLVGDLSGHADEVYCVDWACDGSGCVSGGKDKTLKIWKH